MENINFMPVWATVTTVALLLLWSGMWVFNKLKAHGVFDVSSSEDKKLVASIKQRLKIVLAKICFVIAVCAGIYFYVFLVQILLSVPVSYNAMGDGNFITCVTLFITFLLAVILSVMAFCDSDMPDNPLTTLGVIWGAFITINLFVNAFVAGFVTGLTATGIMFVGFLFAGIACHLFPDK